MKIGIQLLRSRNDEQENQAFEHCVNTVKAQLEQGINPSQVDLAEIMEQYFGETAVIHYANDIKKFVNKDQLKYSDDQLFSFVIDWIATEIVREVRGEEANDDEFELIEPTDPSELN